MPCYKCPNEKYRLGSGKCMYTSKASCNRAYAAYRAQQHTARKEFTVETVDPTIKRLLEGAIRRQAEAKERMRDGWLRKVNTRLPYFGEINFRTRTMTINPKKGEMLNTIIHEEVHRQIPRATEREVRKRTFEEEKKLTIDRAMDLLRRFNPNR